MPEVEAERLGDLQTLAYHDNNHKPKRPWVAGVGELSWGIHSNSSTGNTYRKGYACVSA